MAMFGRRGGHGSFSELLRSAGHKGVQLPVNLHQPGSSPQDGGSGGNRKPNDAATQRAMDAKNSKGKQPGGARVSHGTRKSQKPGDSFEGRIARGSAGTSGRVIHHETEMERAKMHPGKEILIGAIRKGRSSHESSATGRTKMSPEVGGRPGIPAHQSVLNRGIKPTGGFKHSFGKRMKLARSIEY